MKLLYINDALAIYGGIERILVDKMNALSAEGYEVYLITVNQGNHEIPFPLHPKVVYYDLNIRFHQQYQYHGIMRLFKLIQLYASFREKLSEKLQTINPDIILCTRIKLLDSIAKVSGNIPLVFESHTSCLEAYYSNLGRLKLMLFNYINRYARKAQLVVPLTEEDAKEWRKINPNVVVIPNIVHLNNTGVNSDCTSKSAVYVGRFSDEKDIGSLLQIWKLVYASHPDWSLHIYGGYGGQYDTLVAEINRMNANIVVHKPTPHIIDEYANHSMLLLTSTFEPFGLVMPEAMSCGLPVVAFDCPYGPAEIITDGVDGFVIPDRNIKLFAEKVCWLIEHPEERLRMGQSGVASSQRYSVKEILPLWKSLFEQLQHRPK